MKDSHDKVQMDSHPQLSKSARHARLMENVSGYAFISPWLIGFLAFSVIPILFSLFYSFTQYDILATPVFNGLANFRRMASDTLFWQSLKVTFFYAFISVPARLVFAFFVAMLFNRNVRGVRIYQMVYYLPSIVGGSIAIAVMWRRLFMADGAINGFLNSIGIPSTISWIGNSRTTKYSCRVAVRFLHAYFPGRVETGSCRIL